MICPNCGGEYADWVQKCPYCGSTNDEADEKLYMQHMEELRLRLEHLDEEAEERYERSILKKVGVGLIYILCLFAVSFMTRSMYLSSKEKKLKELERNKEQIVKMYEKLNAYYDEGDFDHMLSAYNKYDKDYLLKEDSKGWDPSEDWEHYVFCEYYYSHKKKMDRVKSCIEKKKYEKEDAYGDEFVNNFYNVLFLAFYPTEERIQQDLDFYEKTGTLGFPPDDAVYAREYRDSAMTFLKETLGRSEEQLEKDRIRCQNESGWIDLEESNKIAEEILESLKEKKE